MVDSEGSVSSSRDLAARRQMQAWLALVVVLAAHVADEASTDFLGVYNPLVLELRSRIPWFPMPTFSFAPWLAGLCGLVLVLALLGPAVRRGSRGTRVMAWALSVIMFLNALGHLGGSAYFRAWLPGTSTAPFLLVASAALAHATWRRRVKDSDPGIWQAGRSRSG